MPEALLHYFFAATANESQALLALGYRHLYGINVERSCPAAALYYVAEAQHVVKAAQRPGGLVPVRPRGPRPCQHRILDALLQCAAVQWALQLTGRVGCMQEAGEWGAIFSAC